MYIDLWYLPPANSAALDDLYSIFESLDVSVFSSFILLGDFNWGEPERAHTSETALRKCVNVRACLLAAIHRKF